MLGKQYLFKAVTKFLAVRVLIKAQKLSFSLVISLKTESSVFKVEAG